MPQLEFATYAAQIFWLAVIFVLLYIFLSRKSLPVILEVLHNRQSRIAGDIKKAENLRAEAEAAEVDFTTAISEARQKASKVLSEAKAKVTAEETTRSAKIEKTFASHNKDSENRMLTLRKDSLSKIVPVAAQAASLMTEKLIGKKIDQKQAEEIALKISNSI